MPHRPKASVHRDTRHVVGPAAIVAIHLHHPSALRVREVADPQIGGFVTAAAGMAEEDPLIAEQIDNNAQDQFLISPNLREALTDAAVLNEGAFGKLTGESERAEELIRLIGAYLYQSRRAHGAGGCAGRSKRVMS